MKKYKFLFILSMLLPTVSIAADAVPCFVQLVKAACWQGYDVSFQLKDGQTQQDIGSPMVLDKNTMNTTQQFTCTPNQQITLVAKFSPEIWKGTLNKTYQFRNFWTVPVSLPPKTLKWVVGACFANDFIAVPAPTHGNTPCACNYPQDNTITPTK